MGKTNEVVPEESVQEEVGKSHNFHTIEQEGFKSVTKIKGLASETRRND